MVRTATTFHADLTAGFDLFQHRLQPAFARQTLPPDWLLMTIHAVDLKHVLGQVDPNLQNRSGLLSDFKLHWVLSFLLHHDGP
ncbi:hypothetical protein D3C80_1783110 [compost metagenome]